MKHDCSAAMAMTLSAVHITDRVSFSIDIIILRAMSGQWSKLHAKALLAVQCGLSGPPYRTASVPTNWLINLLQVLLAMSSQVSTWLLSKPKNPESLKGANCIN